MDPTGNLTASSSDIEILNCFLGAELGIAHGHALALMQLRGDACADDLTVCRESHVVRMRLLSDLIVSLGGVPLKDLGSWGAVASYIENDVESLGKGATITLLEQREGLLRSGYLCDVNELGDISGSLIRRVVIPEQIRTHVIMKRLRTWVMRARDGYRQVCLEST